VASGQLHAQRSPPGECPHTVITMADAVVASVIVVATRWAPLGQGVGGAVCSEEGYRVHGSGSSVDYQIAVQAMSTANWPTTQCRVVGLLAGSMSAAFDPQTHAPAPWRIIGHRRLGHGSWSDRMRADSHDPSRTGLRSGEAREARLCPARAPTPPGPPSAFCPGWAQGRPGGYSTVYATCTRHQGGYQGSWPVTCGENWNKPGRRGLFRG
jgi:hypothetical protein